MILSENNVIMGQRANDKNHALTLLGRALVEKGLTLSDYAEALKTREAQVSTYLGAGIAIPHGAPAFKDDVLATGVVAMHFADGVDWGDGDTVYLAVAIAAKSDEHLAVLRQLTHALEDEGTVQKALQQATNAQAVVAVLTGQPLVSTDGTELATFYQEDDKASDSEALLTAAVALLKQERAVDTGFLAEVIAKPFVALAPTTYCVQASQHTLRPAVAVMKTAQPIVYGQHTLQYLLVIAGHASLAPTALDTLLDSAMTGELAKAWLADTLADDYYYAETTLLNRHGLHARPATALAQLAGTLGEVMVAADDGEFVSAKSLMRLLSLGASYGTRLRFRARDEHDLAPLVQAVQAGLGEEVVALDKPVSIPAPIATLSSAESLVRGTKIGGIIAAQGLAVAPAYVVKEHVYEYARYSADLATEQALLNNAITTVRHQLAQTIATAKIPEIAGIFGAHQAILADEELLGAVAEQLETGLSAPAAWHDTLTAMATQQAAVDNPLIAERANDLKDIGTRVLDALLGLTSHKPSGEYVLVKEELLPSDMANLDEAVVAIVTVTGGASSHSAIIARSLGIPALVGAGASVLALSDNELVLVDAQEGYLVASPDSALVADTLAAKDKLAQLTAAAKHHAHDPAITEDKHAVGVMANLGDVALGQAAVDNGAEGVGLLRTEFVFMQHNQMPDEPTQIADYAKVFDVMEGRPVVARTLDIGGDKPLPYLAMKAEDNPFLGVRGVRLTLQRPELLKQQLTALIVAAGTRPLRIMFPMVGQLFEWQQAHAILQEVLERHPHNDLQVGIMIEVPSAALMAEKFAPYVDFFSIGTNDLTQYVLAIDRGHPILSAQADGLHPSVLQLIAKTVQAAHRHGKWVGVCGELGADSVAIPLLVGLGVDELSVSVGQIALTKAKIRTLNFAHCQKLASQALDQDSAQAVRDLVQEDSHAQI